MPIDSSPERKAAQITINLDESDKRSNEALRGFIAKIQRIQAEDRTESDADAMLKSFSEGDTTALGLAAGRDEYKDYESEGGDGR